MSNVQGSMINPTFPSSQFSPKLIQDTSSGEVSKAPLESRSGGRNALPEVIVLEFFCFAYYVTNLLY